jgi:O-antigen ligase
LQDKYDFVEEGGPHAHNLALGVLSEMGLAGFLPLALLAGCLLAGARRTPRGSDKQCLLALFFYFACHGAVDYMLNKVVYSDLLFGCIGLFLGMLFLEKSEDIPLTE